MSETDNKIRLNEARRNAVRENLYGGEKEKQEAREYANKIRKINGPIGALKKAKDVMTAPTKFQMTDVPIYGMALALALFKDILDLAIGFMPGLVTIITWCISMAIGLILMFDGVSRGRRMVARNLTKKFLVLIAGTIVEGFLIGLNFFPFEMMTVGIIYWMTLVDRKKATRNMPKKIINEYEED